MKIALRNTQRCYPVKAARIRALIQWLIRQQASGLSDFSAISVIVTDNEGITGINGMLFGKNIPTDAISLPYRPLPGPGGSQTAELFVNAERAWELGRTPDRAGRELALYIAHGLNHLGGASDRTPRLRARMRRQETAWLQQAARLRLLTGLVGKSQRPDQKEFSRKARKVRQG